MLQINCNVRFVLDPHGASEIRLATFKIVINNELRPLNTVKRGSIYVYNAPRFSKKKKPLLLEGTQVLPVCSSGKRKC